MGEWGSWYRQLPGQDGQWIPQRRQGWKVLHREAVLGWESGGSTRWGTSLPREAAGLGPWNQNHLGMPRAGAELGHPAPAQTLALTYKPKKRDTTGCSHPAQGQTPVQQLGQQIPKGHQIPPGHRSPPLLCPRPHPLLVKAL